MKQCNTLYDMQTMTLTLTVDTTALQKRIEELRSLLAAAVVVQAVWAAQSNRVMAMLETM